MWIMGKRDVKSVFRKRVRVFALEISALGKLARL